MTTPAEGGRVKPGAVVLTELVAAAVASTVISRLISLIFSQQAGRP